MIPEQAREIAARLAALLGDDLVGLYLHGSFALGCGNPNRSDLDLLVVTRRPLTESERDAFTKLPAGRYDRPGWPRPLEVSSLTLEQLHPWRHPTPYDLHLAQAGPKGPGVDADLAAHVTVARRAGISVVGPPPVEVFPEVPRADFEHSLLHEGEWWWDTPQQYSILTLARIAATLAEPDELHTKDSGAVWTLERLPHELGRPLELALASYRGDGRDVEVPPEQFRRYAEAVRALWR